MAFPEALGITASWSSQRGWPESLRFAAELGLECRRRPEDDRYGLHLRVPGGELGAEQAREVAAIACTVAATIEVTRRGLLGLDGLAAGNVAGVAARLEAVGLAARGAGPLDVVTHPWAGLDPEELVDPRPLAWRLAAAVRMGPPSCEMMLDGRESPAPACWAQGIALIAGRRPNGGIAYRLLVGGARGPHPRAARKLPAWIEEAQVPDVIRLLLSMAARFEGGTGARLVRLVGRHGAGPLLDLLEENLGQRLVRDEEPLLGVSREEDDPGWFAQKQPGLWARAVGVLPGALTAESLEGLAELSERQGDGTLRTMPGRRLALASVATADRAAVEQRLDGLGLGHDRENPSRRTACVSAAAG